MALTPEQQARLKRIAWAAESASADTHSIEISESLDDVPWLLDLVRAQAERIDRKEVDCEHLIDENAELERRLDQFAYTIAPIEVIGEHSSGNDPWSNALDLVAPAAEIKKLRARVAEMEGVIGGLHETVAAADADRDRLAAQVAELRKRTLRWDAQARDHFAYYNGTDSPAARYEYGKAVTYDALGNEVRAVLDGGDPA